MTAGSTPDSAPNEGRQQPKQAAQSDLPAQAQDDQAVGCADDLEGSGLDLPGNGGLGFQSAAFPPLSDFDLTAGPLGNVFGPGAAACNDAFHPLSGLADTFSRLADFGSAAVLASIELPMPCIPSIAEVVGPSLLDGLAAGAGMLTSLNSVRDSVFSLPLAIAPTFAVPSSLNGLNASAMVRSVMEPHLTGAATAVSSILGLSQIAHFQPFSQIDALARHMNSHIADLLAELPLSLTALPNLAELIGPVASSTFGVPGLQRTMRDIFAIRPPLVDLFGGQLAGLVADARYIADWAKQLEPSVLAEARYAYAAYVKGDAEPMKQFLRRCLRLYPVLDDHCQALAVAMYEGSWEQEADLADDQSVRKILTGYARAGCDREYDHQIRGTAIGYIPDEWQQPDTVPGPEDLVLPRLLPWAQRFETAPVRYVVGRLNVKEQAVVRAWTENAPLFWTQAPSLVHQDEVQGDRSRRKLIRLGQEYLRRENSRRELP